MCRKTARGDEAYSHYSNLHWIISWRSITSQIIHCNLTWPLLNKFYCISSQFPISSFIHSGMLTTYEMPRQAETVSFAVLVALTIFRLLPSDCVRFFVLSPWRSWFLRNHLSWLTWSKSGYHEYYHHSKSHYFNYHLEGDGLSLLTYIRWISLIVK